VIEARVHQLQAHDLPCGQRSHLCVSGPDSPQGRRSENPRPDKPEVSLPFVHALKAMHSQASGLEPVGEGRLFRHPFSEREPRAQRLAVDDEPAVGDEHHVGQSRHGLDHTNLVAEIGVRIAQRLPLLQCPGCVHRPARIHPGIDGVTDVEVRRLDHGELALSGRPIHDLTVGHRTFHTRRSRRVDFEPTPP
jgi:hypothetical protein